MPCRLHGTAGCSWRASQSFAGPSVLGLLSFRRLGETGRADYTPAAACAHNWKSVDRTTHRRSQLTPALKHLGNGCPLDVPLLLRPHLLDLLKLLFSAVPCHREFL